MKKYVIALLAPLYVLMVSCSSEQSLQEYYVDNAENPNFLLIDVPASILSIDNTGLTPTEEEALASLKKLNILAFKKTSENSAEFTVEKENVRHILSNKDYVDLMKMNTVFGKATVKYLGDEDAIDEVIVYGENNEKGFALVRVLGNDMNPANFMHLMQAIEKSKYNGEGLKELHDLFQD